MGLQEIVKKVRLSLARMPALGYGHIPEAPVHILRDLWHGDSVRGMYLVKGELIYQDHVIPLYPGVWANKDTSSGILRKIHGFSWLRDMRELGTENARLTARGLVLDWMELSAAKHCVQSYQPDILSTRLVNWLGHYDFFAASADASFHYYFMRRIVMEGRYIVALLPYYSQLGNHKTFTLLKGAMALSLCLPEQFDLIPRITRYLCEELSQQILEDGIHKERNPKFQVSVLQDLVEMRMMYQLIHVRPPSELMNALDTVSRALRSLRHGDGGLALFNGSCEGDCHFIDAILAHATPKKVAMTDMGTGGYIRCYANRSTLLVDCGAPAETAETVKHAGALSFELSVGRQRMIVNCGTSDSSIWESALSGTAAHSVMKLEDTDSVQFSHEYRQQSEIRVSASHEIQDGAHWLDLKHDGWLKPLGAVYYRKLYLSSSGTDLIGEEHIEGNRQYAFIIRFHLHPAIKVQEKSIRGKGGIVEKSFLLSFTHKQEGKQEWSFRFSGAEGRIEDSVYFGQKIHQNTKQIVLYGVLGQANEQVNDGNGQDCSENANLEKTQDEQLVEKVEETSRADSHEKAEMDATVLAAMMENSAKEGMPAYMSVFHEGKEAAEVQMGQGHPLQEQPLQDNMVHSEETGQENTAEAAAGFVENAAVQTDGESGDTGMETPCIVRWALRQNA